MVGETILQAVLYTCAYTTHIITHIIKKQKHLISPMSSFVLCLLHRAEWKGVPVVNSMHRHTDSTSWLTLALFYMPATGIPGSLSVSMVTEVASLNSVCTGSPRGPPRLSDDEALQNLHQGPPTTPGLLALCPAIVWYLVSLSQECQAGLWHVPYAWSPRCHHRKLDWLAMFEMAATRWIEGQGMFWRPVSHPFFGWLLLNVGCVVWCPDGPKAAALWELVWWATDRSFLSWHYGADEYRCHNQGAKGTLLPWSKPRKDPSLSKHNVAVQIEKGRPSEKTAWL